MKNYKLTIPKPCHEDWDKMTPNQKGRFCDLCSKTVMDFTGKTPEEIKTYLIENKGQRVCGRFKRSQLDSIVIQIPDETFTYQLSFQKMFILALLLTMGTILFSCKTDKGKVQKIKKVEVIDSITKDVIDTLNINSKKDSLPKIPPPPKPLIIKNHCNEPIDNIETGELPPIENIVEEEILEEDTVVGYIGIPENPYFKNSKRENFNKELRDFVIKEFSKIDLSYSYLEEGTHRFIIRFEISEKGLIKDIKFRPEPNAYLKEKLINMLKKVPKIVPAKQRGKPTSVIYTLPLTFNVE